MKVEVIVRNEYGNVRAYPGNREAELFAKLAGTKTLTLEALRVIKDLGYEIEQTTPATDLAYLPV